MKDPFALAADFVRVFVAGGRDDLAVFVDAPVHAADPPAALDVFEGGVDDARQAHLDGEFADGVDLGGEHDGGGEVCGGEDAYVVFVDCGHEGPLDGEGAGDGDGVGLGGAGCGGEGVVDHAEGGVGGCGEVAGEEVGEGEGVGAAFEAVGFGEEFPVEEGGGV